MFVYGLNGASEQCRQFLQRCSIEEITGITLFEIINEATHQFMLGEARAKGLIPRNGGYRDIKQNWRIIRTLVDYWQKTEGILALNLLFFSTDEVLVRSAQRERNDVGLMTNDSVIMSCMREYGLTCLATHDGDFDRATA